MAIALLDTFCQEDGRELASNHLLAKPWKKQVPPGRLRSCQEIPDDLGWSPQSHAIKAFGNLAERFADYRRKSFYLYQNQGLGRICWTCWGQCQIPSLPRHILTTVD